MDHVYDRLIPTLGQPGANTLMIAWGHIRSVPVPAYLFDTFAHIPCISLCSAECIREAEHLFCDISVWKRPLITNQ